MDIDALNDIKNKIWHAKQLKGDKVDEVIISVEAYRTRGDHAWIELKHLLYNSIQLLFVILN